MLMVVVIAIILRGEDSFMNEVPFIRKLLLCMIVMLIISSAGVNVWGMTDIRISKNSAVIENHALVVRYDLKSGTHSISRKSDGVLCLDLAKTRLNDWLSTDERFTHYASKSVHKDELGSGLCLTITSKAEGIPQVDLQIILYDSYDFLVYGFDVYNKSDAEMRIIDFMPLTDARFFPEMETKTDFKTLNSDGQILSIGDCLPRHSSNNLLVSFVHDDVRNSLVLGGLTFKDYAKYAVVAADESLPACFIDCGVKNSVVGPGGVSMTLVQGENFHVKYGQRAVGVSPYLNQARHEKEVIYEVTGLDPVKNYTLGTGWWDEAERNQWQSVAVFDPEKPERRYIMGAGQHAGSSQKEVGSYQHYFHTANPEEYFYDIPREAYVNGKMRICVINDSEGFGYQRYDWPYALVNALWIWEGRIGETKGPLPARTQLYYESPIQAPEDATVKVELRAHDPLGRGLEPGEQYHSKDRFYLNPVTSDPFAALEKYSQAVRISQRIHNNPYTFPTVCAWYVQAFCKGPMMNTTSGTVEEMDHIVESGILDYSPVAVRLVPDKYFENTEQGWWDDEHWQKYGHYTEPYETSPKWGDAMRKRGGKAFTYVQGSVVSDDYAESFPGHMLNNDISQLGEKHWHVENYVTYDYTDPDLQARLLKRWQHLGDSGIKGVMFDYPMASWLPSGGFEDKKATATHAYREMYRLCREGLGPDAYIHERNSGQSYRPIFDFTAGLVDSQRVWVDASHFEPGMATTCALRWYKTRTWFALDTDAKMLTTLRDYREDPVQALPEDERRTILTMIYVVSGRLLMANSFRDLSPEVVHDLSRTLPYHSEPRSARPIDAFTGVAHPRVYDFDVTPEWHQVTLFNPSRDQEESFEVPLSGDRTHGALGLDPQDCYHIYDFWNDKYVGCFDGDATLVQQLRAGETRMLSVHTRQDNPQFISTNRHIMQGYVDMAQYPVWDAEAKELRGVSRVVGGDTYQVIIALNGARPLTIISEVAEATLKIIDEVSGLACLSLNCTDNTDAAWCIQFDD